MRHPVVAFVFTARYVGATGAGSATAFGLYCQLYRHRDRSVVIDDDDGPGRGECREYSLGPTPSSLTCHSPTGIPQARRIRGPRLSAEQGIPSAFASRSTPFANAAVSGKNDTACIRIGMIVDFGQKESHRLLIVRLTEKMAFAAGANRGASTTKQFTNAGTR